MIDDKIDDASWHDIVDPGLKGDLAFYAMTTVMAMTLCWAGERNLLNNGEIEEWPEFETIKRERTAVIDAFRTGRMLAIEVGNRFLDSQLHRYQFSHDCLAFLEGEYGRVAAQAVKCVVRRDRYNIATELVDNAQSYRDVCHILDSEFSAFNA